MDTSSTSKVFVIEGMCSKKNITNVLISNVLDVSVGGMVFWVFGYAIVRGDHDYSTRFYGVGKYCFNPDVYSLGSGEELIRFSIACAYVSAATTIPSGSMAERLANKLMMFLPIMRSPSAVVTE